VEGYPAADFLQVVKDACPAQCTLVSDMPGQLTSDYGWDIEQHATLLHLVIAELNDLDIPGILEVSIGHALVVECLDLGMDKVLGSYLEICQSSATWRDAAS
jgi:pyridoxine 5-phosphate synthase